MTLLKMNCYFLSLLSVDKKRTKIMNANFQKGIESIDKYLVSILPFVTEIRGLILNLGRCIFFHEYPTGQILSLFNKDKTYISISFGPQFVVVTNSRKEINIQKENIVSFLQGLLLPHNNFVLRTTLFFFLREEEKKVEKCVMM
jgi:hypothetical protein